METVFCPNCGKPMRLSAMTERMPDGRRIQIYVCPDKAFCGTIVRKPE